MAPEKWEGRPNPVSGGPEDVLVRKEKKVGWSKKGTEEGAGSNEALQMVTSVL